MPLSPAEETRPLMGGFADRSSEDLGRSPFLAYRDDPSNGMAFRQVVDLYRDPLLKYLRGLLGKDAQDAEDVLQTVWMHLVKHRDLYDATRRFGPWLYAIANHLAIDHMRKKRRRHRIVALGRSSQDRFDACPDDTEARDPQPDTLAIAAETRARVLRGVSSLPCELQDAFHAVYIDGLSYLQTAERLGRPVGTVKRWLHVAKRRLREMLVDEIAW